MHKRMHITYTYKVLFFFINVWRSTIILKQRHKYHFQMLSWLNCDFSSYNYSTCIQNNKQFWNNKTIKILCDLYPKCSSIMSTCYWKNYRIFFFFLNLNISYIPHSNCCLSPIYQYINTKSITWWPLCVFSLQPYPCPLH